MPVLLKGQEGCFMEKLRWKFNSRQKLQIQCEAMLSILLLDTNAIFTRRPRLHYCEFLCQYYYKDGTWQLYCVFLCKYNNGAKMTVLLRHPNASFTVRPR